ncbi:MAG TPA: tyrosine--tRNA ligase, partial [Candidatus Limnocylindria bacterium]|nr:tyrosine--tRNA ligase [Candidatus Limnocylindria bacterium]
DDAELAEFLTRGMAEVIVREDLAASLRAGDRQLRIKQGFDPTHPNLHLGHVVPLRKLRKLAQWGHEIVLIVGDWTTQIGDPTDKDESRPMVSHEKVLRNAETYLEQFHLIVPREGTRVVNQSEWFGKFGLRDVIELASRFTAQQMLAREEFRKRLEKKTPIPIKDLLYPLLQAYDSVAIESDVEVGGTDQLFNILAGRELQEQVGQRPQNLLINHLLEGLDGMQMSKSKPKTAIWLTDPPNEIYGKVMSIEDKLMPHYFEWATEMPRKEVNKILGAIGNKDLHPKEAKEKLAWQITSELHTPAAADDARVAFGKQVTGGEQPEEMPTVEVEKDGQAEVNIVELLRDSKIATSRSDALRLVNQGGVSVDGSKADLETMVPTSTEPVIKVGKRKYWRIRWR